MSDKTFSNLVVLEESRKSLKVQLGSLYDERVQPFKNIILKIMEANQIDVFTAMLRIKETLDIYKKTDAPIFFAAAVMEITEVNNFKGFK